MASLEGLLERWRRDPDPLLADAIDVVSDRERSPAFTGTLAQRAQQALDAVAAVDEPALASVLQALGAQRRVDAGAEIAEALRTYWPRDPRVTTALRELLANPPWTSSRSQKIWRRLFSIVENSQDARVQLYLQLEPERSFPGKTSQVIRKRRDALLARWVGPSVATEAEKTTWEDIVSAAREEAESSQARRDDALALHQAVLDDPDDLDVRRIYADALSEQGDPRGLFIQLQLDAMDGNRTRLNKLLRVHQESWLGPLHSVFIKAERVWRDGFLVEAVARPKSQAAVEAALDHPALRLLESLELRGLRGQGYRGLELMTGPQTPRLSKVAGLRNRDELRQVLLNNHDKPIREVRLTSSDWEAVPAPAQILQGIRLRSLDRLVLTPAWTAWPERFSDALQVEHVCVEHEAYPSAYAYTQTPDRILDLVAALDGGWARRWSVRFLSQGAPILTVEGDEGERRAQVHELSNPSAVNAMHVAAVHLPGIGIREIESPATVSAKLRPVQGVTWVEV